MTDPPNNRLQLLGSGCTIAEVCRASGISQSQFDQWWLDELRRRQSAIEGTCPSRSRNTVRLCRDRWGIPHVTAETDEDLFYGTGYAMAQDRLWQMDYLRRKATGHLSEIMGSETLQQDLLVRTVGLPQIAKRETDQLPDETRVNLESFARGVNTFMDQVRDCLPIEFALLDYSPDPWTLFDSIAILGEFRWYLTGRFPVLVIPELAKQALNDEALYEAFLTPEADGECIVPSLQAGGNSVAGHTTGSPDDGIGSNNWVISGHHTHSGDPLLASDPHIAFSSVSCWYENHLHGSSFNAVGMSYVGVPGILFGRNEQVAWGITNNICSQRDLYEEKTSPEHPGCFLYEGNWEQGTTRREIIEVRDSQAVETVIHSSRNGPIVNDVLPEGSPETGPISVRWMGFEPSNELTCMFQYNRAGSSEDFRELLSEWHVPTFSFVFADNENNIGYQCAGKIPIRNNWSRGYRPGWDTQHQWNAVIPFTDLPQSNNPSRGWLASANNRVVDDSFSFPLSGTWSSGHRAQRIREMIEHKDRLDRTDVEQMQLDVHSIRAKQGTAALLKSLADCKHPLTSRCTDYLVSWDFRMTTDSVAATLFDWFFKQWCQAVATVRFEPSLVNQVVGSIGGLALSLLENNQTGWFADESSRLTKLSQTLEQTLDDLTVKLGSDPALWTWGTIHTMTLRHTLSHRGDLGKLLDGSTRRPIHGNGYTVCNTNYGDDFSVLTGANYRLIADMNDSPAGLWAIDAAGQSGQPGNCHYGDQFPAWCSGQYHFLPLDPAATQQVVETTLILDPGRSSDDKIPDG